MSSITLVLQPPSMPRNTWVLTAWSASIFEELPHCAPFHCRLLRNSIIIFVAHRKLLMSFLSFARSPVFPELRKGTEWEVVSHFVLWFGLSLDTWKPTWLSSPVEEQVLQNSWFPHGWGVHTPQNSSTEAKNCDPHLGSFLWQNCPKHLFA